ncbi:MAG: RNA polymerase sigma-70 factor [Chitinophagaceae bacterium]|nr:MAG: RNA polymerase sigma-70 factor [Chitinophagaceae bacterium]
MEVQDTGRLYVPDAKGELAFEQVFRSNFKGLHAYAFTILRDDVMAEEIVQNVFCRLWEKKEQVDIRTSLVAYLYRSVYHESLNYLKHLKVRAAYGNYVQMHSKNQTDRAEKKLLMGELEQKLNVALTELPEQCRTIFQMSRFEELKYQEIADRLGLSVKTVENQMGKALKLLRLKLVDFLPAAILTLLNI